MKIDFNQNPSGIAPAINSEKLAENMATTAENVKFEDGRIVPVKDNSLLQAVTAGSQEIYLHKYEIFYNTCDTSGLIGAFTPISDGEFTISIDDEEFEVTGLDFSGPAADLSACAVIIQAGIRTATGKFETCVVDGDHFVITAYGYISVLGTVSGGAGTDISGASYINGAANGTLTQGEDYSTWEDYPDKKDIVPSPLTNDQFARLYMTDSDGQINVSGLMGDRDLKLPIPADITSVAQGKLIDLNLCQLNWYGGATPGVIACGTPKAVQILENGHVQFTFQFPGYVGLQTGSYVTPTLRFYTGSVYIPTAAHGASTNMVTATPPTLTYDSRNWGLFDITSGEGTYADYMELPFVVKTTSVSTDFNSTVVVCNFSHVGDKLVEGDVILIGSEYIIVGEFNTTGAGGYTHKNCTRGARGSTPAAHTAGAAITTPNLLDRTYPPSEITVTANFHSDFPRERNTYYCVTYLDDIGQESPPSEITALTVANGDEYNLITLPAASPTNIVYRRLYRVALLGDGGVFKKVVDLPIATNTYYDFIPDNGLTIELGPYGNPPIGLDFLVMHPCGSLIGARGRSLFASYPLLPYAWPADYNWVVPNDVTGLYIQSSDVIIGTKGKPNILTGSHPDNFAREELDLNQACVSRDSMCHLGQSVFYASPNGIVEISGASAGLVSGEIFDEVSWEALNPETMIAEVFDKKLFFFHSAGGFQYKNGVTTTFDDVIINLFRDTETDTLYILQNDAGTYNIYKWQKHADNREGTWASKDFLHQHPVTWNVAQLVVSDYTDCTLNFYANNVLVESYTVLNDSVFRLPIMKPERQWRFEYVGDSPIIEWQIGTNADELRR